MINRRNRARSKRRGPPFPDKLNMMMRSQCANHPLQFKVWRRKLQRPEARKTRVAFPDWLKRPFCLTEERETSSPFPAQVPRHHYYFSIVLSIIHLPPSLHPLYPLSHRSWVCMLCAVLARHSPQRLAIVEQSETVNNKYRHHRK